MAAGKRKGRLESRLSKRGPAESLRWLLERPISHRGLHTGNEKFPENSLAAFIRSAGMGFPVELDAHLIADGKVAVFHDHNTFRMTGFDRSIEELGTRELKRLRLLDSEHRIPLLEEVLEALGGEVPLLIELKTSRNEGRLGDSVMKTLEGYAGTYALQSFDPRMVLWLRRQATGTPRGQLAGDLRVEGVPLWKSLLVERRCFDLLTSPDFFGCGTQRLHLRAFAARRRRGTPVLAWTVRSVDEEKRVRRYCDNIIFEGYLPCISRSKAPS